MINQITENMWCELEKLFEPVIKEIIDWNNEIVHSLGKSQNEAFALRVFLTFMKSSQGGEIVITIDVKNNIDYLIVESDISDDEGNFIAEGPSIKGLLTENDTTEWFDEFSQFINDNDALLKNAIDNLDQ